MHKVRFTWWLRRLPVLLYLCLGYAVYGQVVPLPNAHAHNDYMHPRPLHDALAQGFTSIEADVLLLEGELFVGHDMQVGPLQLPTLKETYLEPLLELTKVNNGQIYPGYKPPVYLMIDIKTEAEATYKVLKSQLLEFKEMLAIEKDGKLDPGAVRVFLSGNRPVETVSQENEGWVGIDGRPEDVEKGYETSYMPVISENYFKVLQWNGSGTIPPEEREKLEKLAEKVHRQNKKLRLWAAPDQENAWKTLLEAGVDLINTDRLEDFSTFMAGN